MKLVHEYVGAELKTIHSSSKGCKFTNEGIILEAKFAKVSFEFTCNQIELRIRKISGNGKLFVQSKQYVVHSKSSESFLFEMIDEKIEIVRPQDSVGEICILGLGLYEESQGDVVPNWKALISKCGQYSCLRVVGDKLFASEGAYIEGGDSVVSFTTEPPNFAYREGGIIKFRGSCEITNLEVGGTSSRTTSINYYPNRDAPIPIVPQPLVSEPIQSIPKTTISVFPNIMTYNEVSGSIIYDSLAVNEFTPINKPKSKTVGFINSNGQNYLLLRKGGVFGVTLSGLEPGKDYQVVVSGKRINGNGRITGSIQMAGLNGAISSEAVVFENRFDDLVFQLNAGPQPGTRRLQLAMLDDGNGEVLISRIRVTISEIGMLQSIVADRKIPYSDTGMKRFVIVIPSYNNEKWCKANIESALNQNYDSFRVIFTDDCSSDGTFEKAAEVVRQSPNSSKCTIFKNSNRLGALHNLYNMIHSCDDDEIILTLDGDDWLPHENVLTVLNDVYSKNDVWMTYGQYQNYPDKGNGIAQQIPTRVIDGNAFRSYQWCSSHLRTFYTWLFKSIKESDLKQNDQFFSMTWDMAMMFPMLEMAGHRSKFISDVLYIYNLANPINDHKVNVQLQQNLDRLIRGFPKYMRLSKPITYQNPFFSSSKKSVGLMFISTGKYHKFIQGLVSSADSYFLNDPKYHVTYFLFSDKRHHITSNRPIEQVTIEHKPFPFASMDRFQHFANHAELFRSQDYLFYVDVDCLFVDHVSSEIFGNLTGVQHCGFVNRQGPVETRTNSMLYADPARYKYYFGGGFSGGRTGAYLNLSKWCADTINKDVANGIIPIWHDETALNRYFLDHEPDVVLTPSYHYPQSNLEQYKKIWGSEKYLPKIILLEKKHNEVRY